MKKTNKIARDISPAIGVRIDTDSSTAEIIIVQNDDARGVVQFSSTEYNTTEPNTEQFLTITRSRGTFGLVSSN